MKTSISYSLLAAAMACGLAHGQTTAYTTPVGYTAIGNTTPLADNLPNNTDILVTIPLIQATAWAGKVNSVVGQAVEVQGTPAWTVDQWAPGTPYVITVTSGAAIGLTALIDSNGAATLNINSAFNVSAIALNDTIEVRKATTLGNFFAGNTLPSGLEVQLQSGSGVGTNLAFDVIFTFFGTWFDAGFAAADNAILYPGEAFLIRNTTGTAISSLIVNGTVPLSSRTTVVGAATQQDNAIGYVSPVGETLAQAGLVGASGDELLVFDNTQVGTNKAAAAIYTSFGGSEWFDSGFTDVKNTVTLGNGIGLIYRRAAGAPTFDFADVPSFVPGL